MTSDGDRLGRVLSFAAGGMRAPPEEAPTLLIVNWTGQSIQFENGPLLKHGNQWKVSVTELKLKGLRVLPAANEPSEPAGPKPSGEA